MEIEGTVYQVLEAVRGESPRGSWVRQEMVIEYKSGEFNKKLVLSFWGDKTQLIASLNSGERVKAFFDIESREFKGRWFTTAQVWKLERGIVSSPADQMPPMDQMPPYGGSFDEAF